MTQHRMNFKLIMKMRKICIVWYGIYTVNQFFQCFLCLITPLLDFGSTFFKFLLTLGNLTSFYARADTTKIILLKTIPSPICIARRFLSVSFFSKRKNT